MYNDNTKIYGVSQNPDKDYIMVFKYVENENYTIQCEKCSEQFTDLKYKWCEPCQVNNLKANFINWTSGNENIDNFIQEMQLKINSPSDIIFEWIPYDQFNDIKEIDNGGFATVYSAIWKDGPLYYSLDKKEWARELDKKVALKCLYNSQNITKKFLNEV